MEGCENVGNKKRYGDLASYEKKLIRVIERLGAEIKDYDWTRETAWVEFTLKGERYRFEHSVEKSKQLGKNILHFGSDCFAGIVLSPERLAKMQKDRIYELTTWLSSIKQLPQAVELPDCFKTLGFTDIPDSAEDVKARYRSLAKQARPDQGGSEGWINTVIAVKDEDIRYIESEEGMMDSTNSLRRCLVGDKKGWFHRWSDYSKVIPPSPMMGGHNGGQIQYTYGIIEYENGTVELVEPMKIVFIRESEDGINGELR